MKKRRQTAILTAAVLFLAGLVFWQGQNNRLKRYQGQFFDCFDTVTTVTGYAKSQEEFSKQTELLRQKLLYYHRLFDIYHAYDGINNLKTVNEAAGERAVKVDPEIIRLLKLGVQMQEKTGGKLQVAYGSVLSLWHEYREEGIANPDQAKVPPKEELQRRAAHTDIGDLILDEEKSSVFLADPEMKLDVGSIGKGYAVSRLAEYAREIGLEHLLISVGGNVCAIGGKADGTSWTVAVENPDAENGGQYAGTVQILDQCLVTSGDYQRFYEANGVRYCHIIDPDTNMPPAYFSSVTVLAKDSGMADALSTSLFNMEYETGLALVESLSDTEAMWIGKDGNIRCSSGFSINEEK